MKAASKKLLEVVQSRYWRREDAEVVIAAWRASGDTMSGFASMWSLKADRIARWVTRLEDNDEEPSVSFHPVRVIEPARPVEPGPN